MKSLKYLTLLFGGLLLSNCVTSPPTGLKTFRPAESEQSAEVQNPSGNPVRIEAHQQALAVAKTKAATNWPGFGHSHHSANRNGSSVQCSAYTKKGYRCSRMTKSPNGLCYQHGGS